MKWAFLFFLAVYTPLLAGWLRSRPKHAPKVWALLGFLPFVIGPWDLYVAPYSLAGWPGYVKGIEVSVLDAVALAIYASVPRKGRLHLKLPILAYGFAVLISALQTVVPIAALFYVWQILRILLVFAAVATVCQDERAPKAIMTGFVLGLALQAGSAGLAFLSGATQSGGGFGHQNTLGLISHFITIPTFALLLAGRREWPFLIGPIAGVAVAIFTASRATIGLVGIGLVGILVLSLLRRSTSQKMTVALFGLLALGAATPLALNSLDRRFEAAPLGSYDERAAFEKAAWMMISDRPMGIGANQYVSVANVQGYSERAGVAAVYGSRSAHVHNVYLLVAAETGYLGFLAFSIMFVAPIIVAFRCASRNRKDWRGDLLLGLGFALVIVGLHSAYEWVFVTFLVQYVFAIAAGLIVGVAGQLGYWDKRAKRKSMPPVRPIGNEVHAAGA